MKLHDLVEQTDSSINVQNIARTIARDCAPYLKEVHAHTEEFGTKTYGLLKGRRRQGSKQFELREVRTDRRPKDLPLSVHKYLDQLFVQNFKAPFRSSSFFALGSYNSASRYGTVYAAFPIGEFKYVWSPIVNDLFPYMRQWLLSEDQFEVRFSERSITTNMWEYVSTAFDQELPYEVEQAIEDAFDAAEYTNKGLYKALTQYPTHEIMIATDRYYLIDIGAKWFNDDFFNQLQQQLTK